MAEQLDLDAVPVIDAMPAERLSDPDLYRRMLTPRPGVEVAAAMKRFFALVSEAREACGVADLVFIASFVVETGEGKGQTIVTTGSRGDESLVTPMLATTLGERRRAENERLDALARGQRPGAEPPAKKAGKKGGRK